MIKRSHVPFSGTQIFPLGIFIRERKGFDWLLGLQCVKDQLELEKYPIKILYFI